jgi:hypothetical protein
MGFRSLITNFSSETSRVVFFDFSKKSAFSANFARKCTSNILGTIAMSNRPISKIRFYSVLALLMEMVFHIVVIKIQCEFAEIELAKKKLSKFSLVGIIPY